MQIAYKDILPKIHPSAFIAPGAMIIGAVTIGEESSIWFNCVLRGDLEYIEVGDRTNIQDGTVVHLDPGFPCVIGDDVTIGHGAIVHGCTVEDGAMISMGATILTGAKIGERAIVAAGAVVREGTGNSGRRVGNGNSSAGQTRGHSGGFGACTAWAGRLRFTRAVDAEGAE